MSDTSAENTERVPWCGDCEAFAVPNDDGNCGECGTTVVFRDGEA